MAEWTNRILVGAAVMVMAPVTARLASPGGGSQAEPGRLDRYHAAAEKKARTQAAKQPAADCEFCDPAASERVSSQETQREFGKTLCDFLVLYGGSQAIKEEDARNETDTGQGPKKAASGPCTSPPQGRVEAMIAILPDPVHTHLALRFDRAVDDLENSAQRLGWRFQTAWLPWSNGEDAAPDRFQERYIDERMKEKREEQPGLLLFRTGDAGKPLVVLVVGDTPTSGVNEKQFRKAVDQWKQLNTLAFDPPCQPVECPPARRRLSILGPTFSGSSSSLKRLLDEQFASRTKGQPCGDPVEVAVATGTVTSSAQLHALEAVGGDCASSLAVNSESFAADLTYVRTRVLRFLDQHLTRKDSGIAELNEEESQFGTQTSSEAQEAADEELGLLFLKRDRLTKDAVRLEKMRSELSVLYELELEKALSPEDKPVVLELEDDRQELEGKLQENSKEIFRQQNLVYFLDGLLGKEKQPIGTDAQGSHEDTSVECSSGSSQEHEKKHPILPEQRERQYGKRRELLCGTNSRPLKRTYLQLTFPREISLLRKAYQQSGILGFGGSGQNAPKTQLQLNFGEESSSGDAVPAFSGTEGATSMESRMAQIAATLEKEKVSVALLSATDVLDEIFVARYLRAHAPSVTIVIQDADVLFLRGGSDASLDGTYVVSPYPLIPRNGVWSADADSPVSPSPVLAESQGDKGVMNAANFLLCGGEWGKQVSAAGEKTCGWKPRQDVQGEYLWMDGYEPPLPVARSSANDYKLQPPVWLSVVGHGGFQPVALVDFDQQEAELPESSSYNLPRLGQVTRQWDGDETRVWDTHPHGISDEPLVQVYVCTLLLGLLLALHGSAVCSCRLNRQFFWGYAAADRRPWSLRLSLQAGLGIIGIYALSLLLIRWRPGLDLEPHLFKWLLFGMQIAVAGVNGMAAWRTSAGKMSSRKQWYWTAGVLLLSACFAVAADSWLPRFFGPPASAAGERNFFFLRSAYPLNGASPTLPLFLLLAALALWLWGRMGKMVFSGYRIPQLPSVGTELRCPCNGWVGSLNDLLGRPLHPGLRWLPVYWRRAWKQEQRKQQHEHRDAAANTGEQKHEKQKTASRLKLGVGVLCVLVLKALRKHNMGRSAGIAALSVLLVATLIWQFGPHSPAWRLGLGLAGFCILLVMVLLKRINWWKAGIAALSLLLVAAVVMLTGQLGPHSLAWTNFDLLVDVLSFGIAAATVHNLLVSLFAWKMLKHECLMPLRQSPLRWGFRWIKGFSWKRLWTSPEGFSPEAQLEYVMRNMEAERRGAAAAPGSMSATTKAVLTNFDRLLSQYRSLQGRLEGRPATPGTSAFAKPKWHQRAGCTACWADTVSLRLHALYHALAREADEKLLRLKPLWAEDYGPLSGNDEKRGYHNGEDPLKLKSPDSRKSELQRQADEEFVAMIYLSYIRSVLVQIRNRIGTAAGLYILLLWALTGYPWMNRHGILLQMSGLLGLLAVTAILIFSEMQKDDILSRTTETEPGKLDADFFVKILSVVGIPALTLVASQFPEFGNLIFSWVEPGLSTIR